MCSLKLLGRLKCRATGSDASLSFFSTSRKCSRNRSPTRLPVSPMYSFLHNVPLTDSEKSVLSRGLNFVPIAKSTDEFSVKQDVEK